MSKVFLAKTRKNILGQFEDPTRGLKGQNFEVNGWITSDFVSNVLVPIVGFHPYPLTEQFLLVSVLCWFKPDLIFEWGTNVGKSARIFYETAKAFNLKTKIFSIDLPSESAHAELPKTDQYAYYVKDFPEITLMRGDGLASSLEIISKNNWKHQKIIFFLDGDHSYESILNELKAINEIVPTALFVIHDTFNQTEESGYNTGPYRAVNSFLNANKSKEIIAKIDISLPGMTVIL